MKSKVEKSWRTQRVWRYFPTNLDTSCNQKILLKQILNHLCRHKSNKERKNSLQDIPLDEYCSRHNLQDKRKSLDMSKLLWSRCLVTKSLCQQQFLSHSNKSHFKGNQHIKFAWFQKNISHTHRSHKSDLSESHHQCKVSFQHL